ncbi:MAG: hypothetical protein FWG21_03890 [Oscillospiraceae bacterium]|nr:hypothetical protein [Oscillospiraceae bacterium]
MKKILSVILMLSMMISCFSGCFILTPEEHDEEHSTSNDVGGNESSNANDAQAETKQDDTSVSVELLLPDEPAIAKDFSNLNISEIVGIIPCRQYPDMSYVGFIIDSQEAKAFNKLIESNVVIMKEHYDNQKSLTQTPLLTEVQVGARSYYSKVFYADEEYLTALEQRTDRDQYYLLGNYGTVVITRDQNIVCLTVLIFDENYGYYEYEYISIDLTTGFRVSTLNDFCEAFDLTLQQVQDLYVRCFSYDGINVGYDENYVFSGDESCSLFTFGWNGLPETRISIYFGQGGVDILKYHDKNDIFMILDVGV